MPRFVILRHDTPAGSPRPSHYDLMLEHLSILRTWAIPHLPGDHDQWLPARRLDDHRIEYLTYEGPLTENRGHVTRADAGTYQLMTGSLEEMPASGQLHIQVQGVVIAGTITLRRAPSRDEDEWEMLLVRA